MTSLANTLFKEFVTRWEKFDVLYTKQKPFSIYFQNEETAYLLQRSSRHHQSYTDSMKINGSKLSVINTVKLFVFFFFFCLYYDAEVVKRRMKILILVLFDGKNHGEGKTQANNEAERNAKKFNQNLFEITFHRN